MTKHEIEKKVRAWVVLNDLKLDCPVCDHKEWSIGDIVAAPKFKATGVVLGGPVIPMVQLICQNCALVKLFAAIPMGLVESK